jgi:hypothetical protein
VRLALLLALLAPLLVACASGASPRQPAAPTPRPDRGPPVGDQRIVPIHELDAADREEFGRSWRLFVEDHPDWPAARDRWLARGGAAPYVLSEALFLHFWRASCANRRDVIARVGENAHVVGEPAVAYFVKPLVTDRWPLKEPVRTEVFNPDNPREPIHKTFTHYDIDNVTRQHAAHVLAMIGEPAVPTLASPTVLDAAVPAAPRLAAYILGAIGSDDAVAALTRLLSRPDWQDRGAAAKGLGFALKRNPAARAPLEQALKDPDAFVRRKAEEALAGRTRIEF